MDWLPQFFGPWPSKPQAMLLCFLHVRSRSEFMLSEFFPSHQSISCFLEHSLISCHCPKGPISATTPRLSQAVLPPWCQDDGHLEAWRNGREVPGFGDAVLVLVDGAGWIVMGDVFKISSICFFFLYEHMG